MATRSRHQRIRNLANALRKILGSSWVMLGITLLFCCLIEFGSWVLVEIYDTLRSGAAHDHDPRIQADAFQGQDWAKSYFEELGTAHTEWHSYVSYRRKPFKGEYINIDDSGHRRTVQKQPDVLTDNNRAMKVFVFGGSTIWGTGARDAYAIPSRLANELAAAGLSTEVTNFGESGYVSTQSLFALQLQLREGLVPDWVIFYDGYNDLFSSYQNNQSGVPQNQSNRQLEFNLLKHPSRLRQVALVEWLQSLSTTRLLRILIYKFAPPRTKDRDNTNNERLTPEEMSRQAVAHYKFNIELVRLLGEKHGFKSAFFWQPSIFKKVTLTDYEKKEAERAQYMEALLSHSEPRIEVIALEDENHFYDLSALFANEPNPIFLDSVHISEQGNDQVAQAMAEILVPLMRETTTGQ